MDRHRSAARGLENTALLDTGRTETGRDPLRHAAQWVTAEDNCAKRPRDHALAGLVDEGGESAGARPLLGATDGIKLGEIDWPGTEAATFRERVGYWVMVAFKCITKAMSIASWREGGCEMLVDLHPDERFVTFGASCVEFSVGVGQFLHYAKIASISRDISSGFPVAPLQLQMLLSIDTGQLSVSVFYRALRRDRVNSKQSWVHELEDPLTDKECEETCPLTRSAAALHVGQRAPPFTRGPDVSYDVHVLGDGETGQIDWHCGGRGP
ncbi:hypothetical protein NDU88_001150 [Pleurodeles waltl]|uniref:Uncharacterized protein n=1 Tax=Pleurodeles waltl TaxID=8319 RepID=A0AAV7VAU7_PLEWA|nr:hypothetical protein NDU88_001150 [Pleurodeles waltl]